jgi:hypothetical protein
VAQKTYGSALHAAKALMAEGGVPRFFLGIPWRTSRMVLEMFMLDKVARARLLRLATPKHTHTHTHAHTKSLRACLLEPCLNQSFTF